MHPDPSLSSRLLHEQVRLLARNVPALIVGTLLLAAGTAGLLLLNDHPAHLVGAWLAAMTLLCAGRWQLARHYARAAPGVQQTPPWARRFVAASGLAGVVWGSLAWWFFTPDAPFSLAVVAIVLMGILSSATQSLGPYFPAHLAFGLPCVLPFALRCFLAGGSPLVTLGVLSLLFLLMAELFARRIAGAIADALRLRFENEALIEQVMAEKERAEAANRAKTGFLAAASHDLRQPIHAIGLFVPALKRMAQENRVSTGALTVVADRMQSALDALGELLSRLLDLSRLDAGAVQVHAQDMPLAPLLASLSDEVAEPCEAKGLRLRVRDSGLWVRSDPAVLRTILSNLMGNAARYTNRGGLLVAARARGDCVEIQVWDTGIGIAPDESARITEEFFQGRNSRADARQSRGFGLGMSIVNRSAELLGAELRWRSELGRGSMFAVRLARAAPPDKRPTQQGEATATDASQPALMPPPAQPRALTVLVVDEDEDILTAMSFLLRSWGHIPLLAADLAQAVQLAASHKNTLDVALVDFHLARNESGLAVAEQLRACVRPDLPLAIVTGDTTADVMAAVRAAGATMMHKPLEPSVLQLFITGQR